MLYHIEILSVGADLGSRISDAAGILNAVQTDFHFALPPVRLRSFGYTFVRDEYRTPEIWSLLEKYREEAKGRRPYIIAVVDAKLRSDRIANLFGSHQAARGFAAITIRDWHFYADSHRSFLCYYLIRYILSFIAPAIKSHRETRDCFFDFKGRKRDLEISLSSGRVCEQHGGVLAAELNPETKKSVEDMISIMKAQHAKSKEKLPAKTLQGLTQIGIITIREDEFRSVLHHFPARRRAEGHNRFYEHSWIRPKGKNEIGIAITKSPEQGQSAAQAVATDMINELAPRWILLVGIAGGIPDAEYSLGDVILSSRVHDFSVGAAFEGGKVAHQQQGGPVHMDVEKLLSHLAAMEDDLAAWNSVANIGMARPIESVPDQPDDRYYGDENWQRNVLKSMKANFTGAASTRAPIIKVSPIIASNTLVKDTRLAEQWGQSARQASAVEMELGGIYTAARYGGSGATRVLAIRGLSDIVGYKRIPEWTDLACKSAASFAYTLIAAGLLD
jgi:nucleoside phosphorylase